MVTGQKFYLLNLKICKFSIYLYENLYRNKIIVNKTFPLGYNYRKTNREVKVLNSVTLIGRLTRDAEIIKMENNSRSVIKFILAVSRDFINSSGERGADFIPISY